MERNESWEFENEITKFSREKDNLKISQLKLEHRKTIALERQVISLEKIATELARLVRFQ